MGNSCVLVSEWDIRPIGVTCQSPGYTKAMTKWNVGDVRSLMNQWYPPESAHGWDKVGLITGAPQTQVDRILLALDPTQAVVQEALQWGANMIITHHPLLLRGASFLNQESAKGRIISALNRHEIALFNAHTNGDVAQDGVAQACAQALELSDIEVLSPEGVNADGQAIGLGRIGSIKPIPLREFAYAVARVMPKGPTGLFVGGELDCLVRRVAVSPGAGDSMFDAVRASDADVFITADLRHHPASEFLEDGGCSLICASHWATESLWLPVLAQKLREEARRLAITCEVKVSTIVTEPWSLHLDTEGSYL